MSFPRTVRTSYSQNADKSFKRRSDFFRRNTDSNTSSNTQTNVNSDPVTTAATPYIRGTSKTDYRTSSTTLRHIRVAHKPIRRLHVLANVKAIKTVRRTEKEHYTKIKCCDCRTTYIQVRPEETLARDWMNTNERQEMVISETTILNTQIKHQIAGSLRHVFSILQAMATINGSL